LSVTGPAVLLANGAGLAVQTSSTCAKGWTGYVSVQATESTKNGNVSTNRESSWFTCSGAAQRHSASLLAPGQPFQAGSAFVRATLSIYDVQGTGRADAAKTIAVRAGSVNERSATFGTFGPATAGVTVTLPTTAKFVARRAAVTATLSYRCTNWSNTDLFAASLLQTSADGHSVTEADDTPSTTCDDRTHSLLVQFTPGNSFRPGTAELFTDVRSCYFFCELWVRPFTTVTIKG
jgi:hypothetical protein